MKNGDLFVREKKVNPLMPSKFKASHKFVGKELEVSHNVILIDGDKGRTDENVRIIFKDFDTFETDFTRINAAVDIELQSLRTHNNNLLNSLNGLRSLLHEAGIESLLQERFKKQYDFYVKEIRPPFIPKPDDKKKGPR